MYPPIRRTLPALMVLVAMAAPSGAQTPSSATTLKELVVAALETHERVEVASSEIRRAKADKKLARSAILPRLELNGSYTFYADEQVLELAPGEEFVLRPSQDWGWSADLRQTLFYGLRPWRAKNIAQLNYDIAELDRQTTINDLTLEVAAAFFTAIAAEESVEVRATALEQIEKQLHVAERRYEVGESTIADVARWRAEVAAAKQASVVATGEAELARNRLARLTGVAELGELARLGPIPTPDGDGDQLIATAFDTRLEMRTLVNQLEAANLWVKLEKGAWLPELEASAQYFQQKAAFPSSDWASLVLSLKVPIYDGGVTSANVAKAREDLRQVELLERTVRRTIADQVDSAHISYLSAIAALDAARERSLAAREAYRQVERAFSVGEASSVDLLDATTEATDAENSHIIARAQREFQAISLRHAIGLPPLPDLDASQLELTEE
ncbi:MAG: TolC family protein [Holophagae bacterium]|jgi:outer membrane protein